MVRNRYACTSCKKTFSRKYNAERHNKLIHNEMAIVYNKETEWKTDKRKINMPSPSAVSSTSSSLSPSTSDADTNNTIIPEPLYNNLKDLNGKDLNSQINENTDEERVLKIIGKISPLIDELDMLLLSRQLENTKRTPILSSILIASLSSTNPVNFLNDKIDFYRSLIGMEKAILLASSYFNMPSDKSREMLKTIILAAPYSKNKFNK